MNPRTVLVADDSPEVVYVVTRTLEDAGYRVLSAGTVREALDALDAHPDVGLVLSDIRMPGEDGFDLWRVLRHRFPTMPVVLMTGQAVTPDDMVPRGASILPKPIDLDALERLVREKTAVRPPQ